MSILSLMCFSSMQAQSWTDKNEIKNKSDFDKVVEEFDAYWQEREQSKGKGFKPFKRWQSIAFHPNNINILYVGSA